MQKSGLVLGSERRLQIVEGTFRYLEGDFFMVTYVYNTYVDEQIR